MKHTKYLNILIGIVFITFLSCEKTYLEESRITYFADIIIEGNEVEYVSSGSEYVDAGATAYENEVEISHEVTSNVNTDVPGSYSVSYSAVNSDGYPKTVNRSVLVYDANIGPTGLEGSYLANVLRNGSEGYNGNEVTLSPVGIDGLYYISDWIGGFYSKGRGYGGAYDFTGIIQINGNNEVIEISMSNAWGDPFDAVVGTYDPGTGNIAYTASWLGKYDFVVDMSK